MLMSLKNKKFNIETSKLEVLITGNYKLCIFIVLLFEHKIGPEDTRIFDLRTYILYHTVMLGVSKLLVCERIRLDNICKTSVNIFCTYDLSSV